MCGSPSDPVAEPLGNNICWELDCCLVEEVEERVAVHIVHVEQQDDVRKRVQHPNEVINSILGNTWPALFNAHGYCGAGFGNCCTFCTFIWSTDVKVKDISLISCSARVFYKNGV